MNSTVIIKLIHLSNENNYLEHFEKVWKLYPNKKGKGKLTSSKTKLKKIYQLGDELIRCIDRYKDSKEEWKKWQDGSTFFNSGYVDYLDQNYTEMKDNKSIEEILGYE